MAVLYRLQFTSGKCYVGMTNREASVRFAEHQKCAKAGVTLPLYAAWRKHGEPLLEVLCVGDLPYITELEEKAIAAFGTRTPNGYNVTAGGYTSPSTTPEFRAALSANNPMHRPEVVAKRFANGHHASTPEARERARQQQLRNNNMKSAEARAKSSASHKGKKLSEERKQKLSVASKEWHKHNKFTPEQLAKRGAAISAGWARRRARLLQEI